MRRRVCLFFLFGEDMKIFVCEGEMLTGKESFGRNWAGRRRRTGGGAPVSRKNSSLLFLFVLSTELCASFKGFLWVSPPCLADPGCGELPVSVQTPVLGDRYWRMLLNNDMQKCK